MVSASVRGIGVAVITRRSGCSPLPLSRARCSTPNRCCSSTTTRPSRRNSTPSWTSAWVPTTHAVLPAAEPGAPGRPLPRLERGGQERQLHAERLQELAKGHEVLLRQDLRRRHHRRLVAGLDRGQDPERGHHRLPRSDVTLEKAVHRMRRRHVAPELFHTRSWAPVSFQGRLARSRATRSPRGFIERPRSRRPRESAGWRARAAVATLHRT